MSSLLPYPETLKMANDANAIPCNIVSAVSVLFDNRRMNVSPR